jgi:ABC-2 type transport system ATP-binding protein
MEQVEELCEDICIIDRSRAVLAGNLREIRAGWPERFVRMTNVGDERFLQQFPGASAMPSRNGFLNVKLPPAIAPADVLRAAMAAGPIDHFEVVEPSLNAIYLSAVRPEEDAE